MDVSTESDPSGVVIEPIPPATDAAAAISRSFSARSRTVSRSESASGWPAPNVRGTRPLRRSASAAAAASSGLAKRTSRKFVTDGPTCQPAAARPAANRARSPSTRATFASIASGAWRAAVTIVTLVVAIDPGGRYGAIRAIVSGRAIANPTRSPASA